jgi:tripartite-type tricarboxylate transporter receptor subunit TctC
LTLHRRTLLAASLAATAVPLSRPARAGRPIRLLVGAPAGSGADLVARSFAPFLERHLPHAYPDVDNRPQDAGLAAYRALADAPGDLSVLGWVATPPLPARMVDRGGGGLMDRLRLVGAVELEPVALVAAPGGAAGSVADLLARTASDALPLGTPPAGSAAHLAMLRLQRATGRRLGIVPFPTSAAARQAAEAGNVAAAALALGEALPSIRDSRLAGLAVAAPERAPALPDTPTLTEEGFDLTARIRRGLAVPATMAEATVATLAASLAAIAADPEFTDEADAAGFAAVSLDGAGWTAEAAAQRAELAALWAVEPWLTTVG